MLVGLFEVGDPAEDAQWEPRYSVAPSTAAPVVADDANRRLCNRALFMPSTYGKDVWALRNLVPRSIAREVRIESDDDLTITDAGHWSELSPSGTSPAEGTFTGRLTEQGRHEGVNFTITWFDEVGNRREAATWVEGSSSADAWG